MHLRPVPLNHPNLLIVVHHSAANDAYSDAATLQAEYRHRGEGYNFVIDDDWKRLGGSGNDRVYQAVQTLPDTVVSNGTYGLNRSGPWYSWNICIDGNFETSEPTADELHALVQVVAAKAKAWGWKKKDVLWRLTYHQEAGHKYSAVRYGTACPGKNIIKRFGQIRADVARYLPE
ncbi:MAG: N-acetylmuramoyl-L-alanine amidase [Candidatus Sericytochromatia bacterium]